MPTAIPNVTIFSPVLRFKNDIYLVDGQYSYRNLNVPCGVNALVDDEGTWAVPIKDSGIVSTLSFVIAIGDYPPTNPPTVDSVLTLRVRDKYNMDYVWYLVCTRDEYYAACAACCGDSPQPIPDPVFPIIVPCQEICENGSGEFISTFGYPVDAGNYHAHGQFNNEELPNQTSATINGLVGLLNTNWTNIGSPSETFIWAASDGVLTATGGMNGDSLCVLITSDNSP